MEKLYITFKLLLTIFLFVLLLGFAVSNFASNGGMLENRIKENTNNQLISSIENKIEYKFLRCYEYVTLYLSCGYVWEGTVCIEGATEPVMTYEQMLTAWNHKNNVLCPVSVPVN